MAPQESDQVVRLSGLTLVAPTAEHREELGLGDRTGILVTRATGLSARQGLQRGDLILEVNGEAMTAPVDFLQVLEDTPVGEPLKLKIWHKGEEKTLDFYPDRRLPGEEPEEGPKQVA
jgi:S1-C subfamily serine protease